MPHRKLFSFIFILLLAIFGYRIYANWGLITIHANGIPLSKVIAEIQKQGHITLKTNLDPATPITMFVEKVPLTVALDTLSESAEASWHLAFLFAPDKSATEVGMLNLQAADLPENWKIAEHSGGGGFGGFGADESDAAPLDPRGDFWKVQAPKETTLDGYLEEASWLTSAAFVYPTEWNPQITNPPASAVISKSASQLAKSAGGKSTEFFVLLKRAPRDFTRSDDPQIEAWSDDRMEEEIKRLPAEQQKVAQANLDERKADRALTPEQRQQKREARAADPTRREKWMERRQQRFDQRSPEQKQKMFQRIANNKMAAKGGAQ